MIKKINVFVKACTLIGMGFYIRVKNIFLYGESDYIFKIEHFLFNFCRRPVCYANEVGDATDDLADVSMEGMGNAIDKISSLMDGEFEDPTIRPVFDLSEIQNGVGSVGKMMSDMDGYNVDGSFNMARQASDGMNSGSSNGMSLDELTKSIKELAQNPATQMENTFNITSDNPKEVAEEVSRILDKQYQRKATTWG